MMTGVIYKVNLNRGFAFVRGIEDGVERFVFSKDVEPRGAFDTLHEGMKVSFEPSGELNKDPEAKNNGLRALKVRPC